MSLLAVSALPVPRFPGSLLAAPPSLAAVAVAFGTFIIESLNFGMIVKGQAEEPEEVVFVVLGDTDTEADTDPENETEEVKLSALVPVLLSKT